MAGESVEVLLARLDERMSHLMREQEAAATSRKDQYRAIESLQLDISAMKQEVEGVKERLTSAQPTINEFVAIKNKVIGAGKVGHWLWVVGAFLIGLVASGRMAALHWFKGS